MSKASGGISHHGRTNLEGTPGTCVYLVHLDAPYVDPNGRAVQHYIGYSDRLAARMAHHRQGSGSRFLRAVALAGITFAVARIWHPGTRYMERRLKNYKHAALLCPMCTPDRWESHMKLDTLERDREGQGNG